MDIANTFVGPFITKVADYTVTAVGRQLGYIFSYKKNLVDLDEKHVDLVGLREKVQNMVDVEKSKQSKIYVDVEDWLKRVNEFIELHKPKMSEDNESDPNKMSPHCLNLIQRHKLGRKAKKMVEEINEIIEKGKEFDKVGYPLPLPNTDSSSIPGYQSIDSRSSIAKDIKDALADTSNSKVGIYGMGGVGKTMLVKEVERLLKEHNLFDPVITITIGQSIDVKGIQKKMIEMLRWEFKEETEEATAALIRNNLMKMENKILIVLDDLWNELKLEDVGIPGGCKILITSRDKDVLSNKMGVQTNFLFEVKSLSETEAWEFFKNKIGEIDKNSIDIARKVAKKCGGLPIALNTVGKTLKGKTPSIWKNALKRLEKPSAVKIPGMTTEVYDSLRLSYDFIKNNEAKLIFLLCTVFPDDYEIPLEKLSMYAMGMRLLNGVVTLKEARNRMEMLVDVLKSSSLFLGSDAMNHVKMHDVFRNISVYISSEEGCQMSTLCCGYEESEWRDKCGSYRAIFANYDDFLNLPQDLKFPKLELLILISGRPFERKELHQTIFEGMEEIKVLDISGMCFTEQTTSLRNLRTLCMKVCEFKDIDIIGEFKELEVLRIDECRMDELPETISQLTKLKVLNVSGDVKVIPFNIISKMMYLEELSLVGFKGWGKEVVYKGKSIQNAKLSEFQYLPHLTSLDLIIPCVNGLSDLSFSDNWKLDRFNICVGESRGYNQWEKPRNGLRYLGIHSESETMLNDDVDKRVLKRCDELRLEGSVGITNLLFKTNGNYGYPDLRHLFLDKNSDMRHVIGDQPRNCGVNYFSSLDTLSLQRMDSLETIVHMDIRRQNHFNKLRVINVEKCKQLKNLFSFPVFEGLSNLHEIEVCACDLMDGLILMENEEGNVKTKCSIVSLKFDRVPQLTSFCSKKLTNQHRDNLIPFFDDQVAFPKLESLRFEDASNLKMLWNNNEMISNSFCKLQRINIISCDNLRYMFPCSAMTTLVSLEVLKIKRCESLEAIFEMEKTYIVKENDVAVPNLSYVSVGGCPKLKSVFPVSIKRLQQLQTLEIRGACKLFTEDKTLEIAQSNSSRFHEVKFPCLEVLNIYGIDQLEEVICDNQISTEFFPKLRVITVVNQGKIPTIENTKLHEIFRNLEEVTLMSCVSDDFESVHRRLDLQEYDNVLPMLNALTLWGQSKLMLMWHENSFVPKFQNLKELELWNCNTLRYIFTSSTVKGFPCLQTLRVESCSVVQVIADASNDVDANANALLHQLKSLILNDLPNFTPFSNKHFVSKLEGLETLIITQCPQMKTFTVEYSNTGVLSEIEIDGVNNEAEKPINNITSISFFGDQVAFPCLVSLKLSDIDSIQKICDSTEIPSESFGLLRELVVQNCSNLREVFSSDFRGIISNDYESYLPLGKIEMLSLINLPSLEHFCKAEKDDKIGESEVDYMSLFSCDVARHLVRLQVLEVVQCELVRQIVTTATEEDAANSNVDFSRVHSVKLKDLPNLIRFCSDNQSMIWSNSLKTLELERCPNLESLASEFFNLPEEAVGDATQQMTISSTSTPDPIKHEFAIVSLSLHDLDKLKEIWKLDHHHIVVFNHLHCLTIHGCERLRTLFTPTIAEGLSQLRDLIVDSCKMIDVIISKERSRTGTTAATTKITLPHLTTIVLKHLPQLESFLIGDYNHMLQFPLLDYVRVEDCPLMPFFSAGEIDAPKLDKVWIGDSKHEWKDDLERTIGHLYKGQVPYSENTTLDIIDPDEMKEIFEMKLHYKAFRKLKKLHVEGCDEELRNFLSKLLFRFQELTQLHVENCHSLVLFNLERLIFNDKDEVLKKLEELTLSNLPNLMCIWNEEMVKYVSLKTLKRVDICGCGSLVNLFSPTKARDLQQLEVLNIHECDMMEEIFSAKAEGDGDKFQEILLPKLHHLQLIGLSNLKTFHSGNYAFELPLLKTLWIERCSKLKSLTPGFITTPKSIDGISEESVKNKMVGFPRLERLYLKSLNDFEEIWQESVASESFTELQEMEIDDCGKLSNVIPHDMLPRLEKLERILVKDCRSLRKVFDLEAQIINGNHVRLITVFENLQVLKLSGGYNLNNLFLPSKTRSFVKDKETVNVDFKLLPKLKFLDLDLSSLTLGKCPVTGQTLFERELNLKNVAKLHLVDLGSFEQIWYEELPVGSLQKLRVLYVEKGEKLLKIVPSNMLVDLKIEEMYVQRCDSLKHIFDLDGINSGGLIPELMVLVLNDLPKMERIFSKEPTGISVFQELKSLRIIQCESLSSLFPASVAKYFNNLQELKVLGCNNMQEVIVADEKVSTADTIFPDLKCLVLKQLPQLTCFYGGKNKIEWRMLNEVRLKSNPRMETFGHGSQITPELKAIHVTFLEKHWKGGLNETIKFLHQRNNNTNEDDKAKKDKGKEIVQEPY